jgi:acetyl esterase/lipase
VSAIGLFFIKTLLRRIKRRAKYQDLQFSRRGFEKIAGRFNKPLKGFSYQPVTIAGMKSEWVIPKDCNESRMLLYFHGGGYATGSINTHRALVSQIARNAGIKALIIEYRLAPENKYPAAIEDAAAAYKYLLNEKYLPIQIAFGGDSAGGGIAISVLLYLRDNNIPLPKCAVALSPWLDHTLSGNSYQKNKGLDPMLVAEAFPLWSESYLGESVQDAIYASPIFHDLKGLPPIYIQAGEEEMLLDDSTRFEEKASADGVQVLLEIYPKMFHVFNAFWRILPKAREANLKLGNFIKQQFDSFSL